MEKYKIQIFYAKLMISYKKLKKIKSLPDIIAFFVVKRNQKI